MFRRRVADRSVIDQARARDGVCLYGLIAQNGCSQGLDVHHIQTKGSGGDDDLMNLICLCRRHHNDAGAWRITPEQLHATLTTFYGYVYKEIE